MRTGRVVQRLGLNLFAPSEDMINWRELSGVAMDVVGETWGWKPVPDGAADEFADYVRRVKPAVADFTGLKPLGPIGEPVIFSRSEWIVTTCGSIRPLMGPFLERIVAADFGNPFLRSSISAELGLVLGYLSRRVLGQYDISMLESGADEGHLFFIYPNIVDAETKLEMGSEEFRIWLVLHELTHAFQFQCNPWLRGYIRGLINEQLGHLKHHLEKAKLLDDGKGATQTLESMFGQGDMRELMSVEDNPVFAKTQALMSVIEGHSEFVMERVAATVGGERDIAALFEHARHTKSLSNKLFERLIGLQVKLDQYDLGYKFISQAAAADIELVNRLWEGPENLPTITELGHPELWISRMLK
jgi:coenzyme F420 biosynthesis associated uncharacterized protein